MDGVLDYFGESLRNVETKSKTVLSLRLLLRHTKKLVENCLMKLRAYSAACIQNADAELCSVPAAANQNSTYVGVANGISYKIGENAFQQSSIAFDRNLGGDDFELQALLTGLMVKLKPQAFENRRDLKG